MSQRRGHDATWTTVAGFVVGGGVLAALQILQQVVGVWDAREVVIVLISVAVALAAAAATKWRARTQRGKRLAQELRAWPLPGIDEADSELLGVYPQPARRAGVRRLRRARPGRGHRAGDRRVAAGARLRTAPVGQDVHGAPRDPEGARRCARDRAVRPRGPGGAARSRPASRRGRIGNRPLARRAGALRRRPRREDARGAPGHRRSRHDRRHDQNRRVGRAARGIGTGGGGGEGDREPCPGVRGSR